MGALVILNPVLLFQWNDEIECMTVEITTGLTRLRCVVGYGPQLSDSQIRKEQFRRYLDQEVCSAKDEGAGLVIEVDSNAWAGKQLIPRDPNIQNGNGKVLENFLKKNTNMTIVNALPLCEGTITRKKNYKLLK